MTRSLTCFVTISVTLLATWSVGASAQTSEEDTAGTVSAQVEEEPSVSVEPTPVATSPEAASPPEGQRARRRGEVFSDLYVGAAVTKDSPYKVDGITQDPGVLCGAQCGTAKSPVGGLRIGYFFERFAWLGVAGDISYFIQAWGIQSAYEITTIPISALVMFRAPLIKSPEYPNGRAQPYLAVGPSLFISTAELASGWAFLGTGHVHSDTSVDPGLDARFGMRLIASDWISVVLEYRLTFVSPTWQVEGHRVETQLRTNHFVIGLGIHY
ncbi:MAG: hypothetical protein DRH23_09160 [Deltaproteobacteria bacterium]|nr:MAG: hypothetical protein DRH23_09160 [Deltaproteobacteria bacterium]